MVEVKGSNFEEVLSEHENIIYYLIKKFGIRDPDKEFYQEGVIALWKAVETYNPERGKFSSYAYFLIEKALLGLIRKTNRQVSQERDYITFMSTEENQVVSNIDVSFDPYLLESIRQVLTANQMKWFTLFVVRDLSIKEIATQENVTTDAVKNWARLAKPKIRKVWKEQ